MATSIHPPETPPPPPPRPGRVRLPDTVAPPMTRCECSGVTFEEVARRMHSQRMEALEAVRRTGCGQNCGACIPDLMRFLCGR